jgi:hypothetical protein
MADGKEFNQISKKTWYRWSFYINIVLFFIVALFVYLLVIDSLQFKTGGYDWLYITRDIGFLSVALALIFFQFFRNLLIIMRRSL